MIDNLTNTYQYNTILPKNDCSTCKKSISTECLMNLSGNRYHNDCFKCTTCSIQLFFNATPSHLPFIDKHGTLYCITHFIQTLKCKICSKNFTPNCDIQNVNASGVDNYADADDEYLAHVECFKCVQCDVRIQIASEFYFDDVKCVIKCKRCCEMSEETSGLNAKQKDLIREYFFKNNNVSDEANDFDSIHEFSLKNCLKTQTVIQFITKSIQKINEYNQSSDANKVEPKKADSSDNLIDQLSKLDKTLAPNKNPFV